MFTHLNKTNIQRGNLKLKKNYSILKETEDSKIQFWLLMTIDVLYDTNLTRFLFIDSLHNSKVPSNLL